MKTVLRRKYREKRNELTDSDCDKMTDLLLINFQTLQLPFLNCVHTYLASPQHREIDTYIFTRFLQFSNPDLKIVVPRIDHETGLMKHFIFNEQTELTVNTFGILEPTAGEEVSVNEIQLVLTPLLVFDERGYRVGYGKGYYDKFFATCNNDTIKVGLSYFEPIPQIIDVNKFDVPLNFCITPHKVYSF